MSKHHNAPMFPEYRTYRLERLNERAYRITYKTIFGNWRSVTDVFPNAQGAVNEGTSVKYGVPDWEPV